MSDDSKDVERDDEELAAEPSDDGDDEPDVRSIDDVDVIHALRTALKPPDSQPSKIQRAVQKRIRDESRGRFFADGWSTANSPRATFLVTSLLMLAIVVLAYVLLSPQSFQLFK